MGVGGAPGAPSAAMGPGGIPRLCGWVPFRTLEAVEFATLEWVDWFNMRRLLGPIGDVPPAEFEAQYYEQAKVA